jgi:hypothetical protein
MDDMHRHLKPPMRTPLRLWVGIALATALAAFLLVLADRQYRTALRTGVQVEQLRAAQSQRPAPKPSRSEQELQKRWDAYKNERAFTWAPLFLAVERAGSTDIELLEVQPDKASRRVFLRGEAHDEKALTTYLDALASQAAFRNVHLTHQQNSERERLQTVEFEIKATLAQ